MASCGGDVIEHAASTTPSVECAAARRWRMSRVLVEYRLRRSIDHIE